jgi:SAM-dependent methyltransferase
MPGKQCKSGPEGETAKIPMQHPSCYVCGSAKIIDFCAARDRLGGGVWRIVRCNDCGFGWTFPPLAEDQIPAYYPTAYLGDTRKILDDFFSGRLARSRSWRGEMQKVRLVERYIERGKILDVGCGDGKFLWALDAQRWEKSGVEASRDTVTMVAKHMPSIHLIAGSIDSEELNVNTHDAITFWHVLEHLPQPRKVLRRAHDLLRPGGWLFISLPDIDSLQARLFRQNWYPFGDVPRHIFHFSRRSLDLLLNEAGMTVQGHRLFSPLVNFHSLKHSLLQWSEEQIGGRIPYYALKPLLFAFPLLERCTGKYGILTTIAQKPG